MGVRARVVLWAAIALAWAGAARAQAPDDARKAAKLKSDADAAFDAKRYQDALSLYDQSYALAPLPSIFYDRGRVYQYLGQYPRAEDELERFAKEASPELKAKVPGFDSILADVHRHVATVRIVCPVAGAHVLVGSMAVGVTPLPDVRVNAGRQRVDVLADGYYPFHETVDMPGGQATTVAVRLASRDRHGLLVVRSALDGTAVTVDGQSIGIAPAETVLDPGSHGVRVSHDGYSDASTRVVLRAGERKELDLSPLARPSVLTRWWFWTAVGVVVAGGAAAITTYALTTERAAAPGTFSPGAIHF